MTTTGSPSNMPAADVDITDQLVAALLQAQHPDLAALPLSLAGHGWDNVSYRLGHDMAVRLPRRAMAADLIRHEQQWLPLLAPDLPLPVPSPIRVGRPMTAGDGEASSSGSGSGSGSELGFPWHWSVVPWFSGGPAGTQEFETGRAADDLGRFLAALHTPAPADAPTNPGRGGPLSSRDRATVERISSVTTGQQQEELLARWTAALETPAYDGPPLWLHGDLHSHNVLADRGLISAVIDFGDITSGDPATDLALGFSLFEGSSRERFRIAANTTTRPIDDAMWSRAEGWAITVGAAVLANSADNPTMAALGRRMIAG